MSEQPEDVESFEITFQRTEPIPGGAILAFSDEFPDRQFLIIPERTPSGLDEFHPETTMWREEPKQ